MTSQKIDSYFPKEDEETNTPKRARSEGSSESGSPANKKTVVDTDDVSLMLPEDAPFWVPTLFKSIDKMNVSIHVMTVKFDSFKVDLEKQLSDIKSNTHSKFQILNENIERSKTEQNREIAELTESVQFISKAYDEQKTLNEALISRMEVLEQHHDMIKDKCHSYELELVEQASQIDALEQYGRRNCLLIHGVPETPEESTDTLFTELLRHISISM